MIKLELKYNNILFKAQFNSHQELSDFLNENQGIEIISLG